MATNVLLSSIWCIFVNVSAGTIRLDQTAGQLLNWLVLNQETIQSNECFVFRLNS